MLRELEELSYKEIAAVAGVPLGTVMSRLARARKQLQQRLAGRGRMEGRRLNCDDARALVHAYVDGELDLARSLEFERHLEGCADCRAVYREPAGVARRHQSSGRVLPGACGPAQAHPVGRAAGAKPEVRPAGCRGPCSSPRRCCWLPLSPGASSAASRPHLRRPRGAGGAGQQHALADRRSLDGCAVIGPAHGQALVRRQAGFLAHRAGFRRAGFPAGGWAARLCGRPARSRAGVPASAARDQPVRLALRPRGPMPRCKRQRTRATTYFTGRRAAWRTGPYPTWMPRSCGSSSNWCSRPVEIGGPMILGRPSIMSQ